MSPGPEVTPQRKLLAPVWHTLLIVLIMLLNSYGSAKLASGAVGQDAKAITENVRLVQYAVTIVLEFFLLFLVWIGLRMKGTRMRDLIGGRWDTAEAFWLESPASSNIFWICCTYFARSSLEWSELSR